MTTKPTKALFLLITGLVFSLPLMAKTYKWVDDKGITHMGDTIPPEYANKDRQLLNKSGVVTKTLDVLTPEERRAKEAEAVKIRAEESAIRDQKLHDKSLTDTYSSVNEIELSRSRSLQQVEARINSVNSQIKLAENNLLKLQKNAEGATKAGGKVPPALQDEIKSAQDHIARLGQDLEKYNSEKQAVNARYNADKTRYKELTGK
jgi:chromosome segregation ATPase